MTAITTSRAGRIRFARTGRALRAFWAIANLGMSLVVARAVNGLIADRIAQGVYDPTRDFMYFTIQVSIASFAVFLIGAYVGLFRAVDPHWYTVLRASLVPWALVTAAVYNVLLRQTPMGGTLWEMMNRPNELVHLWIPLFIAAEWLLTPGRSRLSFRVLALATTYPWAYIIVCMVRGQVDGWYPYPYLEPNGPLGWTGPIEFMLACTLFIVIVSVTTVVISRVIRHIIPLHETVGVEPPTTTQVLPIVRTIRTD
ncbi:MAG: hypothetical protein RLZ72_287 [Actinomycetota bacterium]